MADRGRGSLMITLKNPPRPVNRVLHLNCPSSSPGGKDYILALLDNGELWTVYGSSSDVRNGRGTDRRCDKDWQGILSDKHRKGYREVGEYSVGNWRSRIGEMYAPVPNIPQSQPRYQPAPDPKPEPPAKPAVRSQQPSSLAEQYPVSSLVRKAFKDVQADEWFCII